MRPDSGSRAPQRWVKDREHRFVRANSAFCAALDSPPDSLVGSRDAEFFPAEAVALYRRDDRLAADSARCVLLFEQGIHGATAGWVTAKTPLLLNGVPAVAGVARPWSGEGLHAALEIPSPLDAVSDGVPAWLVAADRRVRSAFRERLLIRELADESGVHPDYFGHRFGEAVGVPLHTLVRKLRVAWCMERLAEGDSLTALAYHAGFADQSHLTRCFKREAGIPPGAFRDTLERGLA